MLSVNFNLSSTLDLYLEPSPPPLLPSFTGKKNCIFQKRNQFTMIHWIFMNRLSWSCTWSWTPCPRPPPWTSTSSSPPWPSTSTSAWTWTPPLFYPRSQSLAILLNFYLLDLLQNSFLGVAGRQLPIAMLFQWRNLIYLLCISFV